MSFLGPMLSSNQGSGFGASGTTIAQPTDLNQTSQAYGQAQTGLSQQQQFLNALAAQNGINNQSSVFNQQQALANQLQGVANGTGPNPAAAQLNQATGANVANQAALMAGQRGSGANAGLLARQAAQQGAATQQQAVGQGATMQAQQQLAGMNALGQQQGQLANLATNQVGQQAGALTGYNQAAQSEQQALLNSVAQQNNANVGMQSNINNANAGIAGVNAQNQGSLLGGALKGAGSAIAMAAHGGEIKKYAVGGMSPGGPQSFVGQFLANQNPVGQMQQAGGPNISANQNNFKDSFSGYPTKKAVAPDIATGGNTTMMAGDSMDTAGGAGLGNAPALTMVAAHGGQARNMLNGGKVPGQGKVPGDSYSNDNVPAVLSPREIVIPRSITMGENAPQKAAEFVAKILAQHNQKKSDFADGGEEESANDYENQILTHDKAHADPVDQGLSDNGQADTESWGAPVHNNVVPIATPEMGSQSQAPQGTAPQTSMQSPIGMTDIPGLESAYGQQKNAVRQLAKAQGDQANNESNILGQSTKDLQGIQDQYAPQYADIESERQNLMNDYQNGHIDPNRLMSNMGTGQKIGTAIGLILGGIGGGLTHSDNPVQQYLQGQINADIESQKADLGKKDNLLSMNMKRYGNLKDAEMMTRANMLDLSALKLKQAAAQSGSAVAQANAAGQIAQLNGAAAREIGPLKAKQEIGRQLATSNVGPEQKSRIMQQVGIIPQSDAKAVDQAIGQVRESEKLRSDMLSSYDDLKKQFAGGLLSPQDRDSAMQAFAGRLSKASAGRFNIDEARQQVESILPGRTSTGNTDKNKLMRLHQVFDTMIADPKSMLDKYGIVIPKGQPIMEGKPKI